jgi:hypothetical protein
LKRRGWSLSWNRMVGFHRPPITSTVAVTGHHGALVAMPVSTFDTWYKKCACLCEAQCRVSGPVPRRPAVISHTIVALTFAAAAADSSPASSSPFRRS